MTNEWGSVTLGEAPAGPNKFWRAEKLTSPGGDVLIRVKMFGKNKSGTEYRTKHGFTLPEAQFSKETFKGLFLLIKNNL